MFKQRVTQVVSYQKRIASVESEHLFYLKDMQTTLYGNLMVHITTCFFLISSYKPPFRLNIIDFKVTLKG